MDLTSFGQCDDVLLLDEGGFDVELGELGLAVGAEVLVAVAAGDLVVAFHAGDLKQLLEQLRRLRQGVPGAGLEAGRDEEVAGALRGGAGQRRGLDLDEAGIVQQVAGHAVDLGAQAQVAGRGRAAQVQVAVAQARLLADLDVLIDLERQRRGGVQHDDLIGDHLNLAGGQVRVLVAFRAALDGALDLQHELIAQRVEVLLVAHHDLGHARGVAQVEEGNASVVAATGYPTGEGDLLSNVLGV